MKNNKGTYNWIHALNEAGLQAQQNGARMLNEVTAKKITNPARQAQLMAQMPQNPVINPESPSAHPADVMDAISRLGPSSPGTIKLADGDVGAYVDLRRMKQAERMAQMARSSGPIDAKPAGDAQAVEDDVQDGEVADPDTAPPSYKLAAQARAETEELAKQDEEANYEEDEEARHLAGYSSTPWRTVKEAINSKISTMMNEGKKPVRGRIVTGGDSEIPARSPNSLDAPRGIFRGTETPSEKLGKILEIVRDGPEKHGQEVHSWASDALSVMQKQLRKN